MNDIIAFLNVHYDNAIRLVKAFEMTKAKEWNQNLYIDESIVQLGHVFNVLSPTESSSETGRKIDNLGDELADVLLQLINLAHVSNIDMYEVKELQNYKSKELLNDFVVLFGQLTEATMENNGYRFRKDRVGFESSYDFIKDRIFKLFIITFEIANEHNLDMIEEFDLMLKDANGFLRNFKNRQRIAKEYIDFYDSKERILGYCDKKLAHEKGYWHRVFGCMIYNSKTKKVYFQLKNPNHNKIHKKKLLEITAGGHLISGETLEDGTREIREETGLGVEYNQLVFLQKRKINKKIKKNYIIKEFQYFYSANLNVRLEDFKNYDQEEVIGFYELNIKDVINLLNNKKDSILGKSIINGEIEKVKITKNNFDRDFIKDGLYLDLLNRIIMNNDSLKIKFMFNKMYRVVSKDKILHPDKYYFDDGRVCKIIDYKKDKIKYSVMLVNTDKRTTNYLVYILGIKNSNSIPHLLMKEFNSKKGTLKYFNELCNLIENNTNNYIINECYENIFK